MSSCDLIFMLEQETDKLKMVIFWIYFRVIIRPSDLQKFTKLYIYIYMYIHIYIYIYTYTYIYTYIHI